MELVLDIEDADERTEENVKNLFGTLAGQWPMNREYGISPDVLDAPSGAFAALFTVEAQDKVERYVPELEATDVEIAAGDAAGAVRARIRLQRAEETEQEDIAADAEDEEEDYERDF